MGELCQVAAVSHTGVLTPGAGLQKLNAYMKGSNAAQQVMAPSVIISEVRAGHKDMPGYAFAMPLVRTPQAHKRWSAVEPAQTACLLRSVEAACSK